MRSITYKSIHLIEPLQRQFLEFVNNKFDRHEIQHINNPHVVVLKNYREDELTVSQLTNCGYYWVSNASYNARKIALNGYLIHKLLAHDCLFICARLIGKGLDLRNIVRSMFDRQVERFELDIVPVDRLSHVDTALSRLECFRDGAMVFSVGPV